MNDVRNLTVLELGGLAAQIRSLPTNSREYKEAVGQMAIAATYLQDSGALSQMLWWMQDTEPEAPPDGKAEVVEFDSPPRPTPPFLL